MKSQPHFNIANSHNPLSSPTNSHFNTANIDSHIPSKSPDSQKDYAITDAQSS